MIASVGLRIQEIIVSKMVYNLPYIMFSDLIEITPCWGRQTCKPVSWNEVHAKICRHFFCDSFLRCWQNLHLNELPRF